MNAPVAVMRRIRSRPPSSRICRLWRHPTSAQTPLSLRAPRLASTKRHSSSMAPHELHGEDPGTGGRSRNPRRHRDPRGGYNA